MEFTHRLQTFQADLPPQQVFLLSRPADIQYFTGLATLNPEERESFLVISNKTATLLYPSFSSITKYSGIQYHPGHWPSDLERVLKQEMEKQSVSEILIDKSSLFLNEYQAIKNLSATFSELDTAKIWHQRMVKDEEEIGFLQEAGQITSQVMERVLKSLAPAITEKDIAQQIEIEIRKLGAETASFPPVIAFGAHSALPHHQPSDTPLKENMAVLVDMGAKYHGYCGDMTRTVWFGPQPSKKFLEVERIVKTAYSAALDVVKADVPGTVVDLAARDVIRKDGYGNKFIHTTGHGVGLEIHEQPSLYHKKDLKVPENSVITIEPGIYLDGEFGYRYENMVLVHKAGGKELT